MAKPRRKYSEKEITSQIVDYARTLGLHLERRNTGAARYRNADGTERLVRYGKPGDPDWHTIIDRGPNRGHSLYIEIKATGKLPTVAQYDRLVRLNQDGAIACWFDSLDTAMKVIPEVLKGARIRYINIKKAEVFYPTEESHD